MKAYLEIEMPKNCCVCPLFKSNMSKQLFCKAFGAFDKSDYDKLPFERMKNCPLVPVPPHGRLLVADELMLKILDYIDEYSDVDEKGWHNLKWCAMKETEMAVNAAPTIIPAEEGE